MKKLKTLRLCDLSETEMSKREQEMLIGGSKKVLCACIAVCYDNVCACYENGSGGFTATWSNANSGSSFLEETFNNGDAIVNHTNENIYNH